MPAQYEAIRDALKAKGMDEKNAKEHAAKIYIAKGKGAKGKYGRSSRAKALKD